jgi:competence protein ComGC
MMFTNSIAAAKANRVGPGSIFSSETAFSLVELMVSLLLISVAILTIASLVMTGTFINHTSADLTAVTTLASTRVAQLNSLQYGQLTAGGSLDADVDGFSESVDVDDDGIEDVSLRWLVTDLGSAKRVEVLASADDAVMSDRQSITLVALVARP